MSTEYTTAFEHACAQGHLEIVQILSSYEPELLRPVGPMFVACKHGHLDVLDWLLRVNAYTHVPELIEHACKHGQKKTLDWLCAIPVEAGLTPTQP